MKKNIWLEEMLVIIGLVIGLSTSAFAGGKRPAEGIGNDSKLSKRISAKENLENHKKVFTSIAKEAADKAWWDNEMAGIEAISRNTMHWMVPMHVEMDRIAKQLGEEPNQGIEKAFALMAGDDIKTFTPFFTQALIRSQQETGDMGKAPEMCVDLYIQSVERNNQKKGE